MNRTDLIKRFYTRSGVTEVGQFDAGLTISHVMEADIKAMQQAIKTLQTELKYLHPDRPDTNIKNTIQILQDRIEMY